MYTNEEQQGISNVSAERMTQVLSLLKARKLDLERKKAEIAMALLEVDGDIEVLEKALGISTL